MTFFFIIQGEGRGHMTQAIALKEILIKHNHQIVAVAIGKSKQRQIPDFFFRQFNCLVFQVESPNFLRDYENKKIRITASVLYNLVRFPTYFRSVKTLHNLISEYKPDIIINFCELLGGVYRIFHKSPIPQYSIAHHFFFFHPDFQFPKGHFVSKFYIWLLTKITAYGSAKKIALSFYPAKDYLQSQLSVIPPLLREAIKSRIPQQKNYYLCYLLNAGYANEIIRWHNQNKNIILHVFWDKNTDTTEIKYDETLTFHLIDDDLFIRLICDCQGFISTSGFESVCEALYLDKKVMVCPVENHFEQECNAIDSLKTGSIILNHKFDISLLITPTGINQPDYNFKAWVDSCEEIILQHLIGIAH